MEQVYIDHQRLNLTDGKIDLMNLAHGLDHIHCRKRGVECEIEPSLVPGLAVAQPGELMPVAEVELDLEPRVVDVEHVDAGHVGVGREVEPVRAVGQDMDDQLDVPSQRFASRDVEGDIRKNIPHDEPRSIDEGWAVKDGLDYRFFFYVLPPFAVE